MKKICQTCDHSYMGFGESGCIYHLRCTLKDEGVDEDFTCNEWRNNYSKIIELEQKLSEERAKSHKLIKALEDILAGKKAEDWKSYSEQKAFNALAEYKKEGGE